MGLRARYNVGMCKPSLKKMSIGALMVLFALSPVSSGTVQACSSMSGGSSMSGTMASCCGSGCHCSMSVPSGELELAQLPTTLIPSAPMSAVSQESSFNDVPVLSPQEKLTSAESPPGTSGKEKIYDLQSDYRI